MTRTMSHFYRSRMILFIGLIWICACSRGGNTERIENNSPISTKTESVFDVGDDNEELQSNNNNSGAYTLKFVYIGSSQQDEVEIETAINDYLSDKINAKIDIIPIDWGPWDDKTNLMIASREKFDIIFTAQWNKHAVHVSKGAFVELDDLLEQYGQGILQSLDPVFLEGAKINGKNYAVPTNKEFAAQGGIIYRSDIAEELGLDMSAVKSISDLDAIYKVILDKKPGMTPIYMKLGETFNTHYIGNYDALGDTSIPGIILKDEESTMVMPNYEVERYVDTLRITRDFFKKGYINKDAATNQTMNMDALRSGDVFSITASLKPGKDEELAIQTGLIGKLAQLELNAKTIATSETAGSMLAISSTSEDPARAMMFINLLHTDKYLNNLLNYGIEGKHYVKINESVIQPTAQTKDYNPASNWMFGNQFLNYVWDTEDPNKWNNFYDFNQNAKLSPGLGFLFDGNSVRAEIAAVVNVDRQYQTALETGSVEIDKVLPEYIERLKAAGIEKIIAEKQAQFDIFLANK
ncbi:putative aldouronate transport system substrate-binding protein [Paenibacillus castaneae]|uniref:ABC transporter substrate-binding protein n=1 Tax=Paenibacillus castaneae TaxID=474957 RepID=UPI001FBA5B0D|nr:ABC transporter substrate-binding protein [Paenibacillus castaneae]NIK76364.1 putative aldouronate transport system substrate-binding protein [Paenibacillus castaneae]